MINITSQCWLCQQSLRIPSHGICCFCLRRLPVLTMCCPRCGLPSANARKPCARCLEQPPCWQSIIFIGDYHPPFSTLIKKIKFSKTTQLAPLLARLLLFKWLDAYRNGLVCKPDRIICVPLHQNRCWKRWFNQTALIAQPLARWLNCSYRSNILQRLRATPPQKLLSATARKHNLQRAFHLSQLLTGQHIALLDDVVTTGSTVTEISKMLMARGAMSVQVWCICRTL